MPTENPEPTTPAWTPEREQTLRSVADDPNRTVVTKDIALALLAEMDRLRKRVAELETAHAPRLCECGHSNLAHTVPAPHSCFAFNQTCPCPSYRQLPPAEAEAQLRKNIQASEARAAEQAAAVGAAGPTCTCAKFPAVHRADLHDQDGQVVDIEQIPHPGWDALRTAKCTRCGWTSMATWFDDNFRGTSAQTYIAGHRGRWDGKCIPADDNGGVKTW